MLAVLYTCGFLGVVYLVIIKDISKDSMPIVQQLISIMSMIQGAIAGFFYGASKAATETNQTMSRIAEASAPAAALAVAAATGNPPNGGAPAQTGPIQVDSVAVQGDHVTVSENKP